MSIRTVVVTEEELPARKRPKIVPSCKERGADESVIVHTPKLPRHPLCSTGHPSEIERASGQYVYPSDGEKCLDACSGLVWHCHRQVVEAASKQMGSLCTNSRFLYDSMVTYAKGLCATFPGNLSCCFFTNSGSEASELAIQIAETVSGGSKCATLREASHGHSMTHRRLTAATSDNACPVPLPDVYRGQHQDPETAGELYAREVGRIIAEQDSMGSKIAAFIHESAVCCAGQTVLPSGYLEAVYKHIRAAGGLCIADEQQGGFGRTGKHFWSFQAHGVCPDIVTLGKSMGNGHPVGAVITTKEIAEKFAGSGIEYFNTFGGNPVSMAVAEAVLSVVEGEGLLAQVDAVGTYLKEGLLHLMEQHTCIGDVRGAGLLVGVDFVKSRESKEADRELASSVVKRLQQDHRILATVSESVVTFRPPLCISKEDCTSIVQALDSILS